MRLADVSLPRAGLLLHSATMAIVCALMTLSAAALNPETHLFQYNHSAWRVQDGLFPSPAYVVTQTADGYLWIGTDAGLFRFDGIRYTPWFLPAAEDLRTAWVTALFTASDDSLWIGDSHGELWEYRNAVIKHFPLTGGMPITQFVEGKDGGVWFARDGPRDDLGPICEAKNGEVRCHRMEDMRLADCCEALAIDKSGSLWFGHSALARWSPGSPRIEISPIKGAPKSSSALHRISILKDGSAWIGVAASGPGLGLQLFKDKNFAPLRSGSWDSSRSVVYSLLLDSRGALWVGTLSGLYRLFNDQVEHLGQADGLSDDRVLDIYEDREGDLWVATGGGLDCLRDSAIVTFSSQHNYLRAREFDGVYVAKDGAVWTGGEGAIDILPGGRPPISIPGKALPGHQVTSILQDHNGQMWVGADDTLSVIRNNRFVPVKRPDGSSIGFVTSMTEDREGTVWVAVRGADRELLSIAHEKVTNVFSQPRIPAFRVVVADAENNLWLGLMTGDLARYAKGVLDVFHYPHPSNVLVNAIELDSEGTVLGASPSGLLGWRKGQMQMLTVANGLPCDSVNTLTWDRSHSLWLYTQCGLVEIPAPEMARWWSHSESVLKVRVFDLADGFRPGLAPFRAAARGLDGKLWFANDFGLQMIDPDHLPVNHVAPPVHVEEITASGKTIPPVNPLTLPALTRNIAIRYTALSFVSPPKVHFRYKLEGQDAAWQEAGTRREAFYTNLGPGRYRFRVMACNNDGVWNEVGDSLAFTIAPAYYQTTWFTLLCLVALACILSLLYVLRMKQAHAQLEQRLGARLEERERISRELHDTLLQGFQGLMLRFHSVLKAIPVEHPGTTCSSMSLIGLMRYYLRVDRA